MRGGLTAVVLTTTAGHLRGLSLHKKVFEFLEVGELPQTVYDFISRSEVKRVKTQGFNRFLQKLGICQHVQELSCRIVIAHLIISIK